MKQLLSFFDFRTEQGFTFSEVSVTFHTYGKINASRSNVVWICHALTASSDPMTWWNGLVGEDCPINSKDHFIVCANILGSCYGTTHPLSLNPQTGKPFYFEFPTITIRDMVNLHLRLADYLGIEQIELLLGGSMGGQQALEWAIMQPERIRKLSLIATNAFHSPWGIALNESQRMALEADATFRPGSLDGGKNGLKAARSIALLSYRNYTAYMQAQTEGDTEKTEGYKAASYQQYQGEKLVKRFNAYSYYYLSKAMDSHHAGRGRHSIQKALARIRAKSIIISIRSDLLFPPEEQELLAQGISDARWYIIDSIYGHDGFLLETEKIKELLFKENMIPL
jgi:homoserine O-acetyltransferase